MLDRRLPLTPAMERTKKREWLEHERSIVLPDQVYVLISNHTGHDNVFYVGIAIRPHVRWGVHQRVARNGRNTLPEYEHMRFVGVENCRMEVVDELGEFTESEWYNILTEAGHKLLNDPTKLVDNRRKVSVRYKHQALLEGIAQPYCDGFKALMGIK